MCGLFGCMAMGPAAPRPAHRGPAARARARAGRRARRAVGQALALRWGHVAGALFSTMARLDIYTCDVS